MNDKKSLAELERGDEGVALSPSHLLEMLSLQEKINRRIDEDWRQRGWQWWRAIWLECAELMEYCDWKWWKHGRGDRAQLHLEIVDIWHFGLSDLLQRADSPERAATDAAEDLTTPAAALPLLEAVERLASLSLQQRRFCASSFHALMLAAEMDFENLRQLYIGKNTLNFFRQAHGYLDGDYRKQWGGREDNEHLSEILGELPVGAAADDIYQALEKRYAEAAS